MWFDLNSETCFLNSNDSDDTKRKQLEAKWKIKDMTVYLVDKGNLSFPHLPFAAPPPHLNILIYKLRMKNGILKITYAQNYIKSTQKKNLIKTT